MSLTRLSPSQGKTANETQGLFPVPTPVDLIMGVELRHVCSGLPFVGVCSLLLFCRCVPDNLPARSGPQRAGFYAKCITPQISQKRLEFHHRHVGVPKTRIAGKSSQCCFSRGSERCFYNPEAVVRRFP